MASKKKGSAFDSPVYGTRIPKGYVKKKNKDGTISYVPPKKSSKKK